MILRRRNNCSLYCSIKKMLTDWVGPSSRTFKATCSLSGSNCVHRNWTLLSVVANQVISILSGTKPFPEGILHVRNECMCLSSLRSRTSQCVLNRHVKTVKFSFGVLLTVNVYALMQQIMLGKSKYYDIRKLQRL